jgi:hypothetical protein
LSRVLEGLGLIDDTSNLVNAKVFINHGTKDDVVNPGFAIKIQSYYEGFVNNPNQIVLNNDLPASHALVSNRHGTDCGVQNDRLYIENCNFDSIQAMFDHFYDNMTSPVPDGSWTGQLLAFSQVSF